MAGQGCEDVVSAKRYIMTTMSCVYVMTVQVVGRRGVRGIHGDGHQSDQGAEHPERGGCVPRAGLRRLPGPCGQPHRVQLEEVQPQKTGKRSGGGTGHQHWLTPHVAGGSQQYTAWALSDFSSSPIKL